MANNTTGRSSGSGLILDRRELMAGAAALGLGFGLGFQGGPAFAQEAPKKGGTLRLGMEGGSPSDSLDPRTYADSIPISYGWQICNGLTEVDEKGDIAGELAESWEAKPGAASWIFNLRKDVTFSSGKTLDADDVIYSLNLHRGETKSGAKDLMSSITDIKKLTPNQIEITLASGDADLPYHLRGLPHPDRAERLQRLLEARRYGRLRARELRAGRAGHHQEHAAITGSRDRGNFDGGRAALHPRRGGPRAGAHIRPDRCRRTASMRAPSAWS